MFSSVGCGRAEEPHGNSREESAKSRESLFYEQPKAAVDRLSFSETNVLVIENGLL